MSRRSQPLSAMTLQFLGAAGTVTGSKFLLSLGQRHLLVDAGLFQGEKDWRQRNWEDFPLDPSRIGDVLLTHAHADHSTYLPRLVREGFTGSVWLTEGTAKLAAIVLRDGAKLQEQQADDANRGGWTKHRPAEPLYTRQDAERAIALFRTVEYGSLVDLGDGIAATWTRAGHILGSASINVWAGESEVLVSGDLGRHDHPLLKPRVVPEGARFVLCESTYGDREHPEPEGEEHEGFAAAIRRTIDRGGQVVVPAFAIDRTEIVLRALTQMFASGRIPDVPVFVDSPMGLAALEVYSTTHLDELREGVTVADFRGLPKLKALRSSTESAQLDHFRKPCIIVSSSGMAEGGRVLHHLARLLPSERNTVVLTGYQAVGTRGRQLEDGRPQVKIHGHYVPVRAEVVRDREFSVHADASDLIDWLAALNPRPTQIFVVHGEPEVASVFARRIRRELKIDAVVARHGEVVSLAPRPASVDPHDEELDFESIVATGHTD
ncbi:MBL fold metallo-hydrolase RNA specificity domain-containing protein [Aestuariimicrobium sp. T2.26MG-19.2B]|uniref:MBL fold metallo-hydrolase RNA specificity domain-containing protein n=1 Tax=Aestuariimicrobium sp. T2.26MG-19.2B TaxID=3040679 RepID=UPI002477C964|nr:MBL fold metallo-hydrolase [Aestuariimicrobium sp. T2.26MG-19.2B]CAI9407888.1 Ribonuclease [Aestuariimicrobium sp. T2.26MG-19.2B]